MNDIEKILSKYPFIGSEILREQAKLNKFIVLQQEARNPLGGQVITGMPHSYNVSDQTYNAVVVIIDEYQKEINWHAENIKKLLDEKRVLDKAFEELADEERYMLYLHYEDKMSYRQIGREYKCGRYAVQRIIEEAKEKIKSIAI
jgi:RNA polymerase sigma factor (sigma-70 family)